MHIGIELLMDPGAEAQVRAIWRRLRDEGVSSTMLDVQARPHVTLTVHDRPDGDVLREPCEAFARAQEPLDLSLASVGTFPGTLGVVYLAPVVHPALLAAHARLHEALAPVVGPSWPYYRPGTWVPHATVGILLDDAQLARAMALARTADLPIQGEFTSVAIYAFEAGAMTPVEMLCEFPLTG